MIEKIFIDHEPATDKYYVYINDKMVGKQYDIAGVLKQLQREIDADNARE